MTNGEKFIHDNLTSTPYFVDKKVVINMEFDAEWWNTEYKEPTTKNDLAQERYQDLIEYFSDEKVAKTILESRKEFKAWLERLRWNTKKVDEIARELEQIKGTIKNDLGVDCISRTQALAAIRNLYPDMPRVDFNGRLRKWVDKYKPYIECDDAIKQLPPVTPQEPKSEWQKAHDILKAYSDGANEMLEKIRAEIVHLHDWAFSRDEILRIIDEYKAETEKV